MKNLINILGILSIAILFFSSCKTREKQVQKSENQSEYKSEASAKIETKTFEIIQDKELSIFDKSNFTQNYETQKEQTKDIQVIREYYENGNLKSEIQKSFSQLSEATKYAIAEMREKLSKEKETSQYWEDSSNHFYKSFEQEKTKIHQITGNITEGPYHPVRVDVLHPDMQKSLIRIKVCRRDGGD